MNRVDEWPRLLGRCGDRFEVRDKPIRGILCSNFCIRNAAHPRGHSRHCLPFKHISSYVIVLMDCDPVALGRKRDPVDVSDELSLLLSIMLAHCGQHDAGRPKQPRHLDGSKTPINTDMRERCQ
jgi:hypothetical protein